jgi:hypothetical protein
MTDSASFAVLLEDVAQFVRRYVVLTVSQADVTALWAAHTHACTPGTEKTPAELVFRRTPILDVSSPQKESGKTRLLEVLACFVANPWMTERVSAAALVRKIAKDRPTLLLD